MNKDKYEVAALEIAKIVKEKQEAYGNSFGKSGKILKILYPHGIKLEQYQDVLTMVRIIDKMFRIATEKEAFGENPFSDLMGYSLLRLTVEEED